MMSKSLYIETELDNNRYTPQSITLMDNGTVQPIGLPKRDGGQD